MKESTAPTTSDSNVNADLNDAHTTLEGIPDSDDLESEARDATSYNKGPKNKIHGECGYGLTF